MLCDLTMSRRIVMFFLSWKSNLEVFKPICTYILIYYLHSIIYNVYFISFDQCFGQEILNLTCTYVIIIIIGTQ
jgi:hypothetical protein